MGLEADMRTWVLLLVACNTPVPGGECVPSAEEYGIVCSQGHVLTCVDDIWVDEGPEWTPDDNGADGGGTLCTCDVEFPEEVVCTYASI